VRNLQVLDKTTPGVATNGDDRLHIAGPSRQAIVPPSSGGGFARRENMAGGDVAEKQGLKTERTLKDKGSTSRTRVGRAQLGSS